MTSPQSNRTIDENEQPQQMTAALPLRYSMVIQWSPEDHVFIASVPELPGCHTHGATYEEAVRMGVDALETWVDGVDPTTLPSPRFFALPEDDGDAE